MDGCDGVDCPVFAINGVAWIADHLDEGLVHAYGAGVYSWGVFLEHPGLDGYGLWALGFV